MNRKKLNADLARLEARAEEIFDTARADNDRSLTEEELNELDEITASKALVTRQIAALDRQRDEAGATHESRGGIVQSVHDNREDKPWGADNGHGFGSFLQAVFRAGTGQGTDPRLYKAIATGMGENGNPADGGFAVPMEFAAGIEKEIWDTGQILSRVNERPIQGNAITFNVIKETSRADGSRRGAVAAYWVDEGTAPDPSRIQLAQVEMKLRKVGALGYITDELMADAPALAAELEEAFTEEIQFEVEDAIFDGTGAGQPQGFLRAPCLVTVDEEVGQSPDTVVFENIQKMWARMPTRSRANAAWFIHYDVEPQLNAMSLVIGVGGVPVYLPPGGLSSSPFGNLMGRPVIPTEYNKALGDLGDIVLADCSRYRVIRAAQGIERAQSMHVRFTQGEQTFRAFYRVDGQAIPRSAITPKNGTNTLSPFVALSAR